MSNYLKVETREAIKHLLKTGHSQRWIARELGVHRSTVKRYAKELTGSKCTISRTGNKRRKEGEKINHRGRRGHRGERRRGRPLERQDGGQECPPSVNFCSGEAGSLGVLGDLGEREIGEITLAKSAKGRKERWESGKNGELNMDETSEFLVRYHDLDVGHLRLRDGKWHFEYTDAFRKNNRISPGRDGTKAQGHKGTKGGSAQARQ